MHMKQIEDGRPNEVGTEQSNKETPTFDDIYVPGIGVRAALDDDGPAGPGFLSEVAQRRTRATAFLNRRAIRTIENVRGVGTRLASTLRTAGAEIRTAARRPRFRVHLASSPRRTLKRIHSRLLNATRKADARLRSTTRKLAVSTVLATSAAGRKLRIVGARSLRVMRSASVPVHRASQYRLRLPSIPPLPAAIDRNLRRAQSSLRSALTGAGNRLRPVAAYKVSPRFYANQRLDPLMLRRALPPLAVLAVIVMFVIEEIATVVRR
jgi:hypothetical protein